MIANQPAQSAMFPAKYESDGAGVIKIRPETLSGCIDSDNPQTFGLQLIQK